MLGYLLSVVFGTIIGYFMHGLVFGEMSVLGRVRGVGSRNISLTGSSNPYLLRGLSARLTSLGLTLIISLFAVLAIGAASFKDFHLSNIGTAIASSPVKSITLLIIFVLSGLFGLYLKSRSAQNDKAIAGSLYDTQTGKSGGTSRML